MTSITLDDEEDYDNYEDNDDDVNEDDEQQICTTIEIIIWVHYIVKQWFVSIPKI